jgi:hypothetical protein
VLLLQSLGGSIIDEARALLAARHSIEKLEQIWGVSEAFDVSDLKEAVQAAVAEYFSPEGDLAEAARRIRALAAPHFHHEVVWRALQVRGKKGLRERQVTDAGEGREGARR